MSFKLICVSCSIEIVIYHLSYDKHEHFEKAQTIFSNLNRVEMDLQTEIKVPLKSWEFSLTSKGMRFGMQLEAEVLLNICK